MSMFAMIESPELFVESVLGLDRNGDDIGGLALSSTIQDEIGATLMAIVPGGLCEDASAVRVAGLGDGTSSLPLA